MNSNYHLELFYISAVNLMKPGLQKGGTELPFMIFPRIVDNEIEVEDSGKGKLTEYVIDEYKELGSRAIVFGGKLAREVVVVEEKASGESGPEAAPSTR